MGGPSSRATSLAAVTALGLLLLAAPAPGRAVRVLREASSSADVTAPLVAAAALLAWLLAAWLLVTLALTLLARAPGAAGRAAAGTVRRVAPPALRRVAAAALGVSVVAGAVTSPASAAPPAAASATGSAAAPGALDWPAAAPQLEAPTGAASPAPPALDWPTPTPPAPPPVLAAPASTGEAADTVVVEPGDSLWAVAERDLADEQGAAPSDAQVAAAWPAWWQANREVVGDDPDLLLPGTPLQPPDRGAAPDPS